MRSRRDMTGSYAVSRRALRRFPTRTSAALSLYGTTTVHKYSIEGVCMRNSKRPLSAVFAFALILNVSLFLPQPAAAFTQSGVTISFIGSGIPMGHEWLTRRAAIEVLLA